MPRDEKFATFAMLLFRPVLAAVLILLSATVSAEPVNVECDGLIAAARNKGKVPQVIIDSNWGIVRIVSGEQYCREPIEEWNRRRLNWPTEIKADAEAPKFLNQAKKTEAPVPAPEPEIKKTPRFVPTPVPTAPIPEPAKAVLPAPEVVQQPEPEPEPVPVPGELDGKRQSIISNEHSIPENLGVGDEKSTIPSLSELVQSRMKLGGEDPEGELGIMETRDDGFMSLGLWIGLGVLGVGLLGGGAFVYLRRAKAAKEADASDDEDEDEEDEFA